MRLPVLLTGLAAAALGACAHLPHNEEACAIRSASTGFPGGSANAELSFACDTIEMRVLPETEPINPSPWYAVQIDSETGGPAELRLDYGGFAHRYHPWMRTPGGEWLRLADEAVEQSEHAAVIALDLVPGRSILAGQPIVSTQTHRRWQEDWRSRYGGFEETVYGRSAEGRDLRAFHLIDAPDGEPRPVLIILGRQHPPEVTGAFALDGFVDAVIDALNTQTGQPFDLLILPVLNPDGVEQGFWRTNSDGRDLNRDWASRSQPEVGLAFDYLIASGLLERDQVIMVDFHSTFADRVYRDGYAPGDWREQALTRWMRALSLRLGEDAPEVRVTRSASGQTAKGVFGGMGALAITWEAGDDTRPEAAYRAGGLAFEALLETWAGSDQGSPD